MIQSPWLLIAGLLVLSFAFFHCNHPLLRRAGLLCILAVTFLSVLILTGSTAAAVAISLGWFFVPWFELLTRVRNLRLPVERPLRQRRAPSEEYFPNLEPLTEELEKIGFECADDVGWETDQIRQHYRLFHGDEGLTLASLSFTEQDGLAFAWLSFTTRDRDGGTWTTWNYPFSYALKIAPNIHLHRAAPDLDARSLLEAHSKFLTDQHVDPSHILPVDPENLPPVIAEEMELQIEHNIAKGILEKVDPANMRYTWRGLCFVWGQFLRDLVRIR